MKHPNDELRALHAQGLTDRAIAELWDVYTSTVARRRQRLELPTNWVKPTPSHGTVWTYKRHRCRCQPCREANTTAHATWRQRRPLTTPAGMPHNASTYRNWGCRCATCTADNTARSRQYKRDRRKRGN